MARKNFGRPTDRQCLIAAEAALRSHLASRPMTDAEARSAASDLRESATCAHMTALRVAHADGYWPRQAVDAMELDRIASQLSCRADMYDRNDGAYAATERAYRARVDHYRGLVDGCGGCGVNS